MPVLFALLFFISGCPGVLAQNQAPSATTGNSPVTTAAPEPTVVGYEAPPDPLGGYNRFMFGFNDVSYRYVLIPVSRGYKAVVPPPVDTAIGNFFYNIKIPVYAVNNLLQGQPGDSVTNVARFLVNSTVGILGIFDPARDWFDLQREETGFTETLMAWSTPGGPYVVLPFFGASDVRDTSGRVMDYLLNPITIFIETPDSTVMRVADNFQYYADNAIRYPELKQQSDDPYTFFRNLYLQGEQRDVEFPDSDQ